ncbi:hypothetical protein KR059_008612, partial [Drosophila kikkawai]
TSSSDSGVLFNPSRRLMRSAKVKRKLIALYADHRCLWNECHKDFFNFGHKANIWGAIAAEMKADSPPDFWKHQMHRLRYKVDLERVKEQKAKSMGEDFESKLFYKDQLNFLNHIFSREKVQLAPTSDVSLEKLPSRPKVTIKEKPKCKAKFCEKMASLDVLRNHHCSNLILSHEAFKKMQKITSGVEKAKPKT